MSKGGDSRSERDRRLQVNLGIQTYAKENGVGPQIARSRLAFNEFLLVIFRDGAGEWILKGSTSLVLRTGGGRFTEDIDMARARQWASTGELVDDLKRRASQHRVTDPLRFEIRGARKQSEADPAGYWGEKVKVSIRSYIGATIFNNFSVDVTLQRQSQEPRKSVEVKPLGPFAHEGREVETTFVPVVAIEGQVADKICAMYEFHGPNTSVSTRFHDLADLARIVRYEALDAGLLDAAIHSECRRRRIDRPTAMVSPGGLWENEFGKQSAEFADYPVELRNLEAALSWVGDCVNEVLDTTRRVGTWDPKERRWKHY